MAGSCMSLRAVHLHIEIVPITFNHASLDEVKLSRRVGVLIINRYQTILLFTKCLPIW